MKYDKLEPQNGCIIIKDLKQEQIKGSKAFVKPEDYMHEDRYVAEIISVAEGIEYEPGSIIIYDGTTAGDLPEVKELIDKDMTVIRAKDILVLIKGDKKTKKLLGFK